MKIQDDGKVARQLFRNTYGYASDIPIPFEKPAPVKKGQRTLPEAPTNPHKLFEQVAGLYWQADEMIGKVKGPKAANLLDRFADIVHRAAKLQPADDSDEGHFTTIVGRGDKAAAPPGRT